MKITSKGQVTIPQAVREQAHLYPHTKVEFEVRPSGEVVIRPIVSAAPTLRDAFTRVRGSANAKQFKNMGTDAFMTFLRG